MTKEQAEKIGFDIGMQMALESSSGHSASLHQAETGPETSAEKEGKREGSQATRLSRLSYLDPGIVRSEESAFLGATSVLASVCHKTIQNVNVNASVREDAPLNNCNSQDHLDPSINAAAPSKSLSSPRENQHQIYSNHKLSKSSTSLSSISSYEGQSSSKRSSISGIFKRLSKTPSSSLPNINYTATSPTSPSSSSVSTNSTKNLPFSSLLRVFSKPKKTDIPKEEAVSSTDPLTFDNSRLVSMELRNWESLSMKELLSPVNSTSPDDGSLERLVLAPLAAFSAERMEAAGSEVDGNSIADHDGAVVAAADTGYATLSRTLRGGKRKSTVSVDSARSSIAEALSESSGSIPSIAVDAWDSLSRTTKTQPLQLDLANTRTRRLVSQESLQSISSIQKSPVELNVNHLANQSDTTTIIDVKRKDEGVLVASPANDLTLQIPPTQHPKAFSPIHSPINATDQQQYISVRVPSLSRPGSVDSKGLEEENGILYKTLHVNVAPARSPTAPPASMSFFNSGGDFGDFNVTTTPTFSSLSTNTATHSTATTSPSTSASSSPLTALADIKRWALEHNSDIVGSGGSTAVTDSIAPSSIASHLSLNRKKSLKRSLSYKETHVAITKVEGGGILEKSIKEEEAGRGGGDYGVFIPQTPSPTEEDEDEEDDVQVGDKEKQVDDDGASRAFKIDFLGTSPVVATSRTPPPLPPRKVSDRSNALMDPFVDESIPFSQSSLLPSMSFPDTANSNNNNGNGGNNSGSSKLSFSVPPGYIPPPSSKSSPSSLSPSTTPNSSPPKSKKEKKNGGVATWSWITNLLPTNSKRKQEWSTLTYSNPFIQTPETRLPARLQDEEEVYMYSLSHDKLAQAYRPLIQQVQVSNFMTYILSVHSSVTIKGRGPQRRRRKKRGNRHGGGKYRQPIVPLIPAEAFEMERRDKAAVENIYGAKKGIVVGGNDVVAVSLESVAKGGGVGGLVAAPKSAPFSSSDCSSEEGEEEDEEEGSDDGEEEDEYRDEMFVSVNGDGALPPRPESTGVVTSVHLAASAAASPGGHYEEGLRVSDHLNNGYVDKEDLEEEEDVEEDDIPLALLNNHRRLSMSSSGSLN